MPAPSRRHAIVRRLHDFIGWHDDDAATVQHLTGAITVIPDICEGEHATIPHAYVMGDLVAIDHSPLVESISRDQVTSMLERGLKGRLSAANLIRTSGVWRVKVRHMGTFTLASVDSCRYSACHSVQSYLHPR